MLLYKCFFMFPLYLVVVFCVNVDLAKDAMLPGHVEQGGKSIPMCEGGSAKWELCISVPS
jgi:hypothetical protein